jgi:hypothetical protein
VSSGEPPYPAVYQTICGCTLAVVVTKVAYRPFLIFFAAKAKVPHHRLLPPTSLRNTARC